MTATDQAHGTTSRPPPAALPSRDGVLTPTERAAVGRAARADVPRRTQALWDPPADRPDPVTVLEEQAATRLPELAGIRYGRMLASPFAFYRGAAAVMAGDLAAAPSTGLRVQLCGDAHLANFGGFASPDRNLVFDINDFDETLPGPWEWDVKRFAASLAVAGRDRGFKRRERAEIVAAGARRYRETLRTFAGQRHLDVWYARLDATGIRRRWEAEAGREAVVAMERRTQRARSRDSMRAFDRLTEIRDGHRRIVSDPPLVVPLTDLLSGDDLDRSRAAITAALQAYRRSLPYARRRLLDGYRYVDLARKVVGVGSVGTRAWIVLLLGRDEDDPLFLQLKEAQPSVLAPYAGRSSFDNQGRRVVEGQRLSQAASDALLGWLRTGGIDGVPRDFYVRQLWDWKISARIETMNPTTMRIYAEACGWTLARAHARSGDRIAIAEYLGAGPRFDDAIVAFAEVYADQNERDHRALRDAVDAGRVSAEEGV